MQAHNSSQSGFDECVIKTSTKQLLQIIEPIKREKRGVSIQLAGKRYTVTVAQFLLSGFHVPDNKSSNNKRKMEKKRTRKKKWNINTLSTFRVIVWFSFTTYRISFEPLNMVYGSRASERHTSNGIEQSLQVIDGEK